MIIPGNMRYNIVVQKKVETKDDYGSSVDNWVDYLNLKAEIRYNSGGKGINANESFNSKAITIKTYYRDIQDDMIIIYNGDKYLINFINVIGFKDGLEINAEKINE